MYYVKNAQGLYLQLFIPMFNRLLFTSSKFLAKDFDSVEEAEFTIGRLPDGQGPYHIEPA
jgi:hypothetical protein